mmetsp:Transcript_16754/g.20672  ORF Transcript_16754/g.20672 Transcript_16754/m.20672 type:complete len:106 (+) Transcript_16754:346-663(+)
MQQWKSLLPKGVNANESDLIGSAIKVKRLGKEEYSCFLADELPVDDPKACFDLVFAAKKQWKPDELDPYINHLLGPDQTKTDLLKKYTRTCRSVDNPTEKILCAR